MLSVTYAVKSVADIISAFISEKLHLDAVVILGMDAQ